MTGPEFRPPHWAQRLLGVLAPQEEREFILGDLLDASQRRGARARWWYITQVIGSIIPLLGLRLRGRATRSSRKAFPRDFATDLLHALRFFGRRRSFVTIAVLTLALGVGASATIFTLVDSILLKPLPYVRSHELGTVWETDSYFRSQPTLRHRWDRQWFTYPLYQEWSRAQRSFVATALYGDQEMTLTGAGEPAELVVFTSTPSLLPLLGANVALGRWFAPGEEGTGTERLAVLSHELWRSRFGGDSAVVGRSIQLDEQPFRVIGVMPPRFRFASLTNAGFASPSVWIPLGSDGGGQGFDSSYEAIVRMRPGISFATASAEVDGLVRRASGKPELGARVLSRVEAETATARRPLMLMASGVTALLLIACANIALLLLGEMPAREREFATRRALGASRGRIARQILTETVALVVAGGALGGLLAFTAVGAAARWAPIAIPRLADVSVTGRGLLICAGLVGACAILVGLVASAAAASDPSAVRMRTSDLRREHRRLQNGLIAAQLALGMVLLTGGFALSRSLQKLTSVDPGLRAEGVLTMSVTLPASRYGDRSASLHFFDRLEERLRSTPGVVEVGATSNLPFAERNQTTSVEIEGPTVPQAARPNVQRRVVRPGYFAALGIPLRSGRLFERAVTEPRDVMIVDEQMAKRLWPNEVPLGKRVKAFSNWFTVIGVVGPVRHARLDEEPRPTFYLPQTTMPVREATMLIRTTVDPLSLASAARQAVWAIDRDIAVPAVSTMDERLRRSTGLERYRTLVIDLFAGIAGILTVVGIFGVTARMVNQRRREIGIRIALGASIEDIAAVVLRPHIGSVVVGAFIGVLGIIGLAPALDGFLFATSAAAPWAVALTFAALVGTSVVAAIPSMRRASRIDPGVAMRDGS